MNIYEHPACNVVVKPPPGHEDTVLPLPAYYYEESGLRQIMCFWKPTPEELEILNANGSVAINFVGPISPMWVGAAG